MVKIRRQDKTFFQFIIPNAPLLAGRGADWQILANLVIEKLKVLMIICILAIKFHKEYGNNS